MPENMAIPTGMVREADVEVKVRANKNSFQAKMKTKIAVVNIPGAARGRVTRKKVPNKLDPSTQAAFSNSDGISLKKLVKIQMVKGRVKVV